MSVVSERLLQDTAIPLPVGLKDIPTAPCKCMPDEVVLAVLSCAGNTFGVAKNVTLHAVRVLACDGTAMVSALLRVSALWQATEVVVQAMLAANCLLRRLHC
jgi:hypothetical protein